MKKNILIGVMVILIMMSFLISSIISFYSLSTVIQDNSEDMAKILAGRIYDEINSELARPISVGQTMACNQFLISLMKQEDSYSHEEMEAILQEYLGELADRMDYNTAFVVSDKSGRYYTEYGFNKVVAPGVDAHDIWYSLFLDCGEQYDFDIDVDEVNNHNWTIFVNNRIEDEKGNLLGVCGVGMIMTNMQKLILDVQEEYGIQVNLVDADGLVQVDVDDINIENSVLDSIVFLDDENEYKYQEINEGYIITKYMDNLGWYLVIQKEKSDIQHFYRILILKNIITLVIIFMALGGGIFWVMHRGNKSLEESARMSGLTSLSSIYASMHLINLADDTFKTVKSTRFINVHLVKNTDATEQMKVVMKGMVDEQYQDEMLEFTDLTTIADRLEGKKTLYHEFIGKKSGWCRARFIAVYDEDIDIFHQVLFGVEIIDEEKKRENRLRYLSETDLMTGIRNRGSGEHKITELLKTRTPGTFFILDADRFKSINDTYGHAVGDSVIVSIAKCLKNVFQKDDIVLRLGGDEFAVYATDIRDEESAQKVVDRVFEQIEQVNIPELKGKKLSISLGAAVYLADTEMSFDSLYRNADSALYISKKTAGNTCTYYK